VELNTGMLQSGSGTCPRCLPAEYCSDWTLLNSEQRDQTICEQAAPTQAIVPAGELLVAHFISFCQ
jgi:hypothetical protein